MLAAKIAALPSQVGVKKIEEPENEKPRGSDPAGLNAMRFRRLKKRRCC